MKVGIIGLGFMGMTHFEAINSLRNVKVQAIATRSEKKRKGDWSSIQGNLGTRGWNNVTLKGITTYEDYHDLLSDPKVDLVDICLPIGQHEKVVLEALKSGKNVLVEKPITVQVKSAVRMVREAEKANKILMVAHVLPFFPEFRFLAECIEKKKYGNLLALNMRRVICPPKWLNLPEDMIEMGGFGIDLHIHDNHFISSTCGLPAKVCSVGKSHDGLVEHTQTNYLYENGPAITCTSGAIASSALQFAHGYQAFFEKATIEFDAGTYGSEWVVNRPLVVLKNNGKTEVPKLKGNPEWYGAFAEEFKAAAAGLKTGNVSPYLAAEHALNGVKMCHAEAKSIETGKPVAIK